MNAPASPPPFRSFVWAAADIVGTRPAKIADLLFPLVYPKSFEVSHDEGVREIIRAGMVEQVKRVLRKTKPLNPNIDPDLPLAYARIVCTLHSQGYTVPSESRVVSVEDLMSKPELLREACELLEQKGRQVVSQARHMRMLQRAVVAAQTSVAT